MVKMRLVGFRVLAPCGGLLLAWMTHATWKQLDTLQREHAAVRSETFYLGVTLRGGIRSLNEQLLQYGRTPTPGAKQSFLKEAGELSRLLATNRVQLIELSKLPLLKRILLDDSAITDRIVGEYQKYLAQAELLLRPPAAPGAASFQERYTQVRSAAAPLLAACNDLVRAQREDFTSFLSETQGNLLAHERLLRLTVLLLVSLAGTLALLVYRGMIAPLRVGLAQSNRIIERQEKLASLGVLASGVAHEIRNPLMAIKLRLFSLKKSAPALASNEDAQVIGNEINRLEKVVKDFLLFARPSEPELADIPAGRIVAEAVDLLSGQLQRAGIELRLEARVTLWIHADPAQLKQVLLNLIRNSAEAIGRDGRIVVTLREGEAEFEGQVKRAAIISIADTGKGIPPSIEPRLFDPFFTTKEGGTGLGLAISSRIVEKHGGLLRYETEVDRGTTFEIVLPLAQSAGPMGARLYLSATTAVCSS